MSFYSISDLEQLSGIKAHTIRMWERRYGIVEPRRTPTNIRFYTDDDLKRLLNVALLVQHGNKISHVAQLGSDMLNHQVMKLCNQQTSTSLQMERLQSAMLDFDATAFNNLISNAISKLGFEATTETLLFPFLHRVGILWQTGTIVPAHEHFASNLIRQKIHEAIAAVAVPPFSMPLRMVFFLPEDESHDMSLLYFSLLARKSGIDVIYLGSSVPTDNLKRVADTKPIDVFFTAIIKSSGEAGMNQTLDTIQSFFSGPVWLTGQTGKSLVRPNCRLVTSGSDFRMAVNELL